MKVKHIFFLRHARSKGVLRTQTFNNRCSALAGAAITSLANPLTFIASGAAVGLFAIFYCFLKVLMVSSYRLGMVLFCYRKRTKPRGYEREEIINTWWVPPSLRKVNYAVIYFFKALCTCHPEQSEGT